MGVYAGPDINESGLVLALDAGNTKNLNIPSYADHGYAEWYCMQSGTATYSIINSGGGIIYERTGSNVVGILTATGPQRGTISVTADRFYYGSAPINLVVEDQQHSIVPLTMTGTEFVWWAARGTPGTCYIYSPYQNATVKFWNNPVANGINSTVITNTLSVTAGVQTSFTFTTPANFEATYTMYMTSTVPILASTTQTGSDKTILSPASKTVYQRFISLYATAIASTPASIQNGCISDPTNFVMTQNIADGAGGDCAQGLGLEYLSDRYSFGNVVSDYIISCPYDGTVTASYWNGSTWVVRESHTITGATTTIPIVISRDGTTGVGVNATIINGTAANMVSDTTTLWKWEGTVPFYLCINDSADDEFSVLGWTSSRTTTPRSSNIIVDKSGSGNNGTLIGPSFNILNGGSIVFDGYNDYIPIGTSRFSYGSSPGTLSAWANATSATAGNGNWIISYGNSAASQARFIGVYNQTYYFGGWTDDITAVGFQTNTWFNMVGVYDGTNASMYINGVLVSGPTAKTWNTVANTAQLGRQIYAGEYWNGRIANVSVYNRALTASEIRQNFNATRGRFGI